MVVDPEQSRTSSSRVPGPQACAITKSISITDDRYDTRDDLASEFDKLDEE